MNEIRSECKVTDDEEHRLNTCRKWNDTNNSNTTDPPHFVNVFLENEETLKVILTVCGICCEKPSKKKRSEPYVKMVSAPPQKVG